MKQERISKGKKERIEMEKKIKELLKILFEKNKNLHQICITGIENRKPKYGSNLGFKINGLCIKREDVMTQSKRGVK